MAYDYERNLEARQTRRMAEESRFLDKLERLTAKAERMIGELCREGRTVYYVFPEGGKYREGSFGELVDFLIRNHYVAAR